MSEPLMVRLAALVLAVTCAVMLIGCSVSQLERGAVQAEHVLTALSEDWGERLDAEIERCEVHPPGIARDECIAPAEHVDRVVAASEAAAVAALRAFWLGVAIGEDPRDLASHLAQLQAAVAGFPVDAMRSLGGAP